MQLKKLRKKKIFSQPIRIDKKKQPAFTKVNKLKGKNF